MYSPVQVAQALEILLDMADYLESTGKPYPEELATLIVVLDDELRQDYSDIPLHSLKRGIKLTFVHTLATKGIIPKWLEVSHHVLRERLVKELDV